jgi:hypothetical protein
MARLLDKLRRPRWRPAFSFVVAAFVFCSACRNVTAAEGSPAPSTKWYLLPQKEALKGQSIQFQGVVLCYDRAWGQFYIHDDSDAIAVYVSPHSITNRFEAGQLVTIKANTTWDETGCTLTNVTAVVIGHQPLPQPRSVRLSDLAQSYTQWV